MDDIKKIYAFIISAPVIIIIFIIALVIMIADGSNGDPSAVAVGNLSEFNAPFKIDVTYSITSLFGTRNDPFTNEEIFHSGIDLSAPEGTEIVASAGGKIYKTGYEPNGLGNYVKIQHDVNGETYYTAYGHMLDNSIVVSEGQIVKSGEKIGIIGSTGRSTGIHVHFMLMSPNCSYNKSDLKDPKSIIDSDLIRRNEYKNNKSKYPSLQPIQGQQPSQSFGS